MTTYSQLSKDITKQLTKKEKKDNGIYFTPPSTVLKNIPLRTGKNVFRFLMEIRDSFFGFPFRIAFFCSLKFHFVFISSSNKWHQA